MFIRLRVLFSALLMVFLFGSNLMARQGTVLWQDNFDDTATDSLGLVNVGWARAGVADGLVNSTVAQRGGEMVGIAGVFNNLVGAVQFQSNGVPFINPLDVAATKRALLRQPPYGNPNCTITFKVFFKRMSAGTFFAVGARMPFNDTSAVLPVANVTVVPGYTLSLYPLQDSVKIAEHSGALAVLAPNTWTYFGRRTFDFNLLQHYWCKFYLREGEIKTKVWQGALRNEPAAWFIEGVDTTPRVTGEWVTFAILGARTSAGDEFRIDSLRVESLTTAVESRSGQAPPDGFVLEQNYPNPFNPSTQIKYTLANAAPTSLEIYNTAGQKVRTLFSGHQTAGAHSVTFDGKDDHGAALGTGLYFYKLASGNRVEQKKMLFVK
jgi:hypothetical protein